MAAARSIAHIPGPPAVRLLGWRGNMLRFFGDPLTYMRDAHKTYGNVVAFADGGNGNLLSTVEGCKGTFFAFGPACNQAILSQASIFQSSPMPSTLLNHGSTNRLLSGIFSMNGDKHKQQRRLMMPAFHKKRIDTYRDDIVAITQHTLDQWQVGTQRNVFQDMIELTLEIACKTLFGVDIQDHTNNIGVLIQSWIKMNLNPAITVKIDLPGTPYRRFTRASENVDAELMRILQEKRSANSDQADVLSMLIQMRDENGDKMTEEELIGQAAILFFAAHETTANALTWTLFLLAQHPTIYADLLEELDGVLHGDAPTVENVGSLELLERVAKESMRLLSPVPLLPRVVVEDTELEGCFIPAASEVIFSPFITHRMAAIYEDPQRFNPDRWLTINPSPYEYISFGGGARMCIGATFAMMELKIVLAMLVQRYRLSLLPDARVDRDVTVTMAPKKGLLMSIHAQDKQFSSAQVKVQGNIREIVDLS